VGAGRTPATDPRRDRDRSCFHYPAQIEQQLVEKGSTSVSSETVVSSLTHLGILLGKALDNTRQLLREGLWLHHNDRDPYHSYRRHRDQTLLKVAEALPQSKWPWMPTYDAAVRQCESLEFQLREESRSVRSLLAAASSISSAKEADAQSQLNFIVATASIAIGVPALVFSLFGSNNFEPLKEFAATHWAWIFIVVPVRQWEDGRRVGPPPIGDAGELTARAQPENRR
jgi:hypothetical protein